MKRKLIAAAAFAAIFSTAAWAQIGPGMMGGGMMGPSMMGPGMTPGYGYYGGINLSDEQRAKIDEIQREASRKQWDLMGKMHERGFDMHQLFAPGKSDDAAARKAYQSMADAHKQMFEAARQQGGRQAKAAPAALILWKESCDVG